MTPLGRLSEVRCSEWPASRQRAGRAAPTVWFRRSLELFQDLGAPFLLARAQVQYAEMLVQAGGDPDDARSLQNAAIPALEALRAEPWLARARALQDVVAT